jgi:hypothetical protein
VLSKLQSLETSRTQDRPTRRDFERRDQNRRISREQNLDRAGNPGPSGRVQVCHVRRDGRDRNPAGDSMRNPRTNRGRRSFYGGQGRTDNCTDSQLNAGAQDFIPCGNQHREGSRSPDRTSELDVAI